MIRLLNEKFVNAWVLRRELPDLRDKGGPDARRLAAAALAAHPKGSPVDCLVLTPDAGLIAVRSVHDFKAADRSREYLSFLEAALNKVKK